MARDGASTRERSRSGDWLRFVYSSSFEKKWRKLGDNDDDLRELELSLLADPMGWPVVKGTGGLRKARIERLGVGKSRGCRVCYVHFAEYGVVNVASVFAKNEKSDLTGADRRDIASWIDRLEKVLERGRGDEQA